MLFIYQETFYDVRSTKCKIQRGNFWLAVKLPASQRLCWVVLFILTDVVILLNYVQDYNSLSYMLFFVFIVFYPLSKFPDYFWLNFLPPFEGAHAFTYFFPFGLPQVLSYVSAIPPRNFRKMRLP